MLLVTCCGGCAETAERLQRDYCGKEDCNFDCALSALGFDSNWYLETKQNMCCYLCAV